MSILGHSAVPARAVAVTLGLLAFAPARADAPPRPESPPRPDGARSGDLIVYEPRPRVAHDRRACSFRHSLCVHGASASDVLAWLDAADRAWDVAVGALSLPPPVASAASPDSALDVYIAPGDPYATRVFLDLRDASSAFDSASAFAVVGRGALPGCALDVAAARVIARAVLYGVAPATDETSAIAESQAMANLMVACSAPPVQGILTFQAHPEEGLARALSPPDEAVPADDDTARVAPSVSESYSLGLSLFYDWLDRSYGAYPGATLRGIWALTSTHTPLDADRWHDEPDGFDVLRVSFKEGLGTGSTVNDLWLAFAVARAFEPGFPPRYEWSVGWPDKPRTLITGSPVAPTGAAYVDIDARTRPAGARLRFEASWEPPAVFLWALVRVDADGKEMSRVLVPGQQRGTTASTTLVDLDGAARVLAVGTSVGEPPTPVDPDDYRPEGHGWIVSLAAE